jgi:potassium large conductance calcium-activated channel subfamily M alpha protein 1
MPSGSSGHQVNLCRTCVLLSAKAPEKSEPVLADKEIIMAALNIRSMDFGGSLAKLQTEDGEQEDTGEININNVTVLLDLAFASNVRYLDDHEMYLTDQVADLPSTSLHPVPQVDISKTLPFASGLAMARGISDSLMSSAYFNGSALRLLRQWVTGGATVELERSLAEGAGLRGGYSTPATERWVAVRVREACPGPGTGYGWRRSC